MSAAEAALRPSPVLVAGAVDAVAAAADGSLGGRLLPEGPLHVGLPGADGIGVLHRPEIRVVIRAAAPGAGPGQLAIDPESDGRALVLDAGIPEERLTRLAGALRDLPSATLRLVFETEPADAGPGAPNLCLAPGGAALTRFDCWLDMQRRDGDAAEPAPGCCC